MTDLDPELDPPVYTLEDVRAMAAARTARPPSRRPPRRDPRASWRVVSVSGVACEPTSYLMWLALYPHQSYSPARAQRRSR